MNYQAVYVQASASQLGYWMNTKYWANPSNPINAQVGKYDPSNVGEYWAMIQKKCGIAPGSASAITGVTAIPAGGSPQGGTMNWTYFTEAMRSRYGIGAQNLLISVGSEKPEPSNNGETRIDWLELPMREVLAGIGIDRPFFAVLDHNGAHHLSAPFVYRAFSRSKNKKCIRILVNFDQHQDFGSSSGLTSASKIRCSTWAGFLTAPVAGVYPAPVVDAYVNLGAPSAPGKGDGDLGGGVVQYAGATGAMGRISGSIDVNKPVADQVREQLALVLEAASKEGTDKPVIEAYISVDRDFIYGSATPWKDGNQSPENGRAAFQAAFKFFQDHHATLMGADICGLPAVNYSIVKGPKLTLQGVLDQAYADIQAMAASVAGY